MGSKDPKQEVPEGTHGPTPWLCVWTLADMTGPAVHADPHPETWAFLSINLSFLARVSRVL